MPEQKDHDLLIQIARDIEHFKEDMGEHKGDLKEHRKDFKEHKEEDCLIFKKINNSIMRAALAIVFLILVLDGPSGVLRIVDFFSKLTGH